MLEHTTKRFIQDHRLIQKGDRILVAVSGGPDSLALLHFLDSNKGELGVEVAAAHLDHMFRGDESFQELQFVQDFCNLAEYPLLRRKSGCFEGNRSRKWKHAGYGPKDSLWVS